MRFETLLIAALLFVGNAAVAQSRPTANDDPSQQCFGSLVNDPRFDSLLPRIGSLNSPSSITFSMATSTDRASDGERRLLEIWASARIDCQDRGEQFRAANAPPEWDAAYQLLYSQVLDLIAEAYALKITWGEFTTKRRQLFNETTARFAELNRQDKENSQRLDEDAHRYASEATARTARIVPLFAPTPPPRATTTNCYRFGSSVQCTTR